VKRTAIGVNAVATPHVATVSAPGQATLAATAQLRSSKAQELAMGTDVIRSQFKRGHRPYGR